MVFWHWILIVLLPAFGVSLLLVAGVGWWLHNRPFQ